MNAEVLKILIPLAFVLIILPLFFRFVIGRIIILLVRRRYIKPFSQNLPAAESDELALKSVLNLLLKRFNSPFPGNYEIRNELPAVILCVQKNYTPGDSEKLKFTFSVSELIKCYFLFMNDLNDIVSSNFWFNRIGQSRIYTLRRINRISGYYNALYNKIPFLKTLRKRRITGKIIRILLIPLLGPPSAIISILISIAALFFTEIVWKYYYAVFLMKCGMYSVILYGRKDSYLKSRLDEISPEEIKASAHRVEALIDLQNNQLRSSFFEKSFIIYQKSLEEFGIGAEKDLDFNGITYRFNKKRRIFKKILDIPVSTVRKYNPFQEKRDSEIDQLINMVTRIAAVYTEKESIFDDLRIIDVFEILYMISVVSYNKLLPGSLILNNITVDLLLKAKDINDEIIGEILKNRIPLYRQIYRTFRMFRKGRVLYKAIRTSNPVGLFFSLSGPIVMEGLRSQVKDYIFQRAGRFTIYCYESNKLNKKNIFKKSHAGQ